MFAPGLLLMQRFSLIQTDIHYSTNKDRAELKVIEAFLTFDSTRLCAWPVNDVFTTTVKVLGRSLAYFSS